jgi:serine/threonine-protein kinase RsbW
MAGTESSFTIRVQSSTENLSLIREFVTKVGEQAGMSELDISKIELAVDEACANVIEHAYGNDKSQEVIVRANVDEEKITFQIVDTGIGFDPTQILQEDLEKLIEKRKSGGLGMRLIKTLMDEVQYEIIPGQKNELRMIKRIKK